MPVVSEQPRVTGRDRQPPGRVGQQHDGAALEHVLEMTQRSGQDAIAVLQCHELAAELGERVRAVLVDTRRLDLGLQPGREGPDQDGGREHDRERHKILGVRDGKREPRRHEEEVERRDTQNRGQHGRSASKRYRCPHHSEQIDHDQVGPFEVGVHERSDTGTAQHDEHAPRIILPRPQAVLRP